MHLAVLTAARTHIHTSSNFIGFITTIPITRGCSFPILRLHSAPALPAMLFPHYFLITTYHQLPLLANHLPTHITVRHRSFCARRIQPTGAPADAKLQQHMPTLLHVHACTHLPNPSSSSLFSSHCHTASSFLHSLLLGNGAVPTPIWPHPPPTYVFALHPNDDLPSTFPFQTNPFLTHSSAYISTEYFLGEKSSAQIKSRPYCNTDTVTHLRT